MGNFTASYTKAILAATRQEDLARPDQPKAVAGVTADQIAPMGAFFGPAHVALSDDDTARRHACPADPMGGV